MNPYLRARQVVVAIAVASGVLVPSSRLVAQDVTITPPAWFNESNIGGDELPELKRRSTPEYPAEMSKSDELGYVLIGQSVDSKGKVGFLFRRATHPYFDRAVEWTDRKMEMRAARKNGKPVDSYSWFAVIFNPAASRTKGPDASPRLLAIAPAFVPAASVKGLKTQDLPVVWGTVSLDERGEPQGLTLESSGNDQFRSAVDESLKHWRFAPARRGDQPIASELRVAFMITPTMKPNSAEKMVMPKVIKRVQPIYPFAMRQHGMRGEVTVGFVVAKDGRVQNAVVVRSTNPVFEEPALEAIRQWKFAPGSQGGKPVNTNMELAIAFSLDTPGGGNDAYTVSKNRDTSKLPEGLQYDTPAKVRGVIVPVYPYELRRENIRGKAVVAFLVDQKGTVVRVEVAEATRPEFGLALTAALEQFSFDPALKDGQPTVSLLRFEQKFNRSQLSDDEGARMLTVEKKHPERIHSAGSLDVPLKPISQRAPVFPVAQAGRNEGNATVDFIVDEEGRVLLPRIVSASAPDFGYSAVQAVSQWRFETPKVNGKGVAVSVRAPFSFSIKHRPPSSDANALTGEPAAARSTTQ
jgi:TonB family protein